MVPLTLFALAVALNITGLGRWAELLESGEPDRCR